MRADYISADALRLLLTALMPDNRRVLQLSMATGLRIGDCLGLRTEQVLNSNRPTVREQKTGKTRRIFIPRALREELCLHAGRRYVFEGRSDWRRARTRQAVWKDLKRVAKLYRLDGSRLRVNVSPHTARKVYAVDQYNRSGSLERVQTLLNHSDPAVTALYALADEITAREKRRKK